MKQTKFADSRSDDCTSRKYSTSAGASWVGHTIVYIHCPFCRTETEAYLWSLCGGGKRCANPDCGAIFGSRGLAYNLTENIKQE